MNKFEINLQPTYIIFDQELKTKKVGTIYDPRKDSYNSLFHDQDEGFLIANFEPIHELISEKDFNELNNYYEDILHKRTNLKDLVFDLKGVK